MKSIIGRKVGMTQVFLKTGALIPVTVIEVLPNIVLQRKTNASDQYEAVKVGYEDLPVRLAKQPDAGQVAAAGCAPKRFIRELHGDELNHYQVGDAITVDIFQPGDIVDVIGINKGKGFSGALYRNNQKIGPKGHGSGYHRGVGSLATNGRDNNRVYPGKKMPGHEGNKRVTVQNLQVVMVDLANNAILIKGAIPGPKRGLVTIRSAVKAARRKPAVIEIMEYAAPVVEVEVEAEVEAPVVEPVVEETVVDAGVVTEAEVDAPAAEGDTPNPETPDEA